MGGVIKDHRFVILDCYYNTDRTTRYYHCHNQVRTFRRIMRVQVWLERETPYQTVQYNNLYVSSSLDLSKEYSGERKCHMKNRNKKRPRCAQHGIKQYLTILPVRTQQPKFSIRQVRIDPKF